MYMYHYIKLLFNTYWMLVDGAELLCVSQEGIVKRTILPTF